MRLRETGVLSLTVLTTLVVACGTESTPPPAGTGGSGGASGSTSGGTSTGGTATGGTSTGGTATGGTSTGGTATGGTATGGAMTGGSSTGGTGGTPGIGGMSGSISGGSGGAGMGGSSPGGTGGKAGGGAGGAAGSGVAGSSGGGTGGGTGKGASPSTGCGKSTGVPMNVNVPNAIVTFPDNYNGSTPVPMMFGFHGAGRTNQEMYTVDSRLQNSELENHFVMVYLKSAGSAWAMSDQSRFDAAYTQLTQNYCIDLNRVFATGHSSGAQFIEQMLCGGETRLKAVTPVAGSRTCASWQNPIPSMLIHGLMDNQRANDGNGFQERDPFITSHMCSMTTTPYTAVTACNSIYDQAAVNHGCVSYSGCAVPFVFCNHNDMNYSGTNHGWPCFANQAMYAFLSAL